MRVHARGRGLARTAVVFKQLQLLPLQPQIKRKPTLLAPYMPRGFFLAPPSPPGAARFLLGVFFLLALRLLLRGASVWVIARVSFKRGIWPADRLGSPVKPSHTQSISVKPGQAPVKPASKSHLGREGASPSLSFATASAGLQWRLSCLFMLNMLMGGVKIVPSLSSTMIWRLSLGFCENGIIIIGMME